MVKKDAEYVLKTVKEKNIRFIRLWFTDVLGFLKGFTITVDELKRALDDGMGFDGSSIEGFARIEESDMILMPDPETLTVIPWTSEKAQKSAIVIGDIFEAFGGNVPSEVCTRGHVAKRAVEAASAMGYTGFFGPELEYFLFQSIDPTKLVWDLWVSPKGGAGDSWGAPRVVPNSPEISSGLSPMVSPARCSSQNGSK